MGDDGILRPREAARLLGVTRQRVDQMLEEGKLLAVRIGGVRFVTTDSLQALLEKRNRITIGKAAA